MRLSFKRSLKYFIYLVVLFSVAYFMLSTLNLTDIKLGQFDEFITTPRGMMMIAAVVGLSVLYPLFGVTTKKMISMDNETLEKGMKDNGFILISKEHNKMEFRPAKFLTRLKYRFDDTIEIDNSEANVTKVTGSHKVIYSVLYKLGGEVI